MATASQSHPNSVLLDSTVNDAADDCVLCRFLPFLKSIFPGHRDVILDPRSEVSSIAAGRSLDSNLNSVSSNSNSNSNSNINSNHYGAVVVQEESSNMDFASADYRGFIFAVHPQYGYLLLHCTRKKKKPPHFQLIGGHVDPFEFEEAAKRYPTNKLEQLQLAGKMGAAREMYEETGLDVRNALHRLEPTRLYPHQHKKKLMNEFKSRLFYTLHLTDQDFLSGENMSVSDAAFLQRAMGANPPPVQLKLSLEHQGFAFEKVSDVASTLLQYHSGGKCSESLKMATVLQDPL
ncbi:NUDIX domain [Seminavis robusta]|uniref:NUDIX domain n=1 Tax=Seminavis robusta TaxID=568900 RepID=A0A9N8H564_9STRA|nr:NUDIX domain [Seminavis robusta]|eukprot:Sro78_g042520.1 NUDIX domain (291) ;mRNA; r:84259-85284